MTDRMQQTNRLRWLLTPAPVLQQLWQETHKWRDDFGNTYHDVIAEEWRDVPLEGEQDGGQRSDPAKPA